MSSSLLMVVQNTPQIEPLPAYRRDPETSSIRSSAPSYVSEAPTYHSTIPSSSSNTTQQRIGLPPANYAPGYNRIHSIDRNGLSHLNFSINQWSSAYSSPQARHYQNVAARRTNLAMIEEQNFLAALTNTVVFPTFNFPQAAAAPAATSEATAVDMSHIPSVGPASGPAASTAAIDLNPSSPTTTVTSAPQTALPTITTASTPASALFNESVPPLEDPDLVGHAAATVARERRLYIARETQVRRDKEAREAQALREETRRWDFLLAQMADWEERERGWKAFSRKFEAKHPKERGSARRVLFRFWK